MLFPEHFLAVRATIDAGHEDAFNRWYDEEHLPEAVDLFPGCLEAARYRVTDGDGSHQFIAMYAFSSEAEVKRVLDGPELKELIRRYDEAFGTTSNRNRTTYSVLSRAAPAG